MCESSQCKVTMVYNQYQQQLEEQDRRLGIVRSRWVHFPDGRWVRRNDADITKIQALYRGYRARKFSAKGTMSTRSGAIFSAYMPPPRLERITREGRPIDPRRKRTRHYNVHGTLRYVGRIPKTKCPRGWTYRKGCGQFESACYASGKRRSLQWRPRRSDKRKCPRGYRASKSKYGGCNRKF